VASASSPSSAVVVTASSLMPSRGVAVAGVAGVVGAGVAVFAVAPAAAFVASVASASASAPSSTGGCCGGLLVCWGLKRYFLVAFGRPRSSSIGGVARFWALGTRRLSGGSSLGCRLSFGLSLR